MFRASDIFRRAPGAEIGRPTVLAKGDEDAAGGTKRPATARTWDPATGTYQDEDLPAEVQELMGIRFKKVKTEAAVGPSHGLAQRFGHLQKPQAKALGPKAVGLHATKGNRHAPSAGEVDTSAPSVEYRGFSKVDLNDRYYEKVDLQVHGKPTYWAAEAQFFLYWQGEVRRWSICDASSLFAVKAGQYPGWAYKENHTHLSEASGWLEAWDGQWCEAALEVLYRCSSNGRPQWDDPAVNKQVSVVEFRGFAMKELNIRYHLRASELIQGKPTFWDKSGVYFIYWQHAMRRWAICDLKCMEQVKAGECPGWAYRADPGFLANATGWVERRGDSWTGAILETTVVNVCSQGLKVEFSGFAKEELNTSYAERRDEEVQGRATFWDPTDTYFIYWQSSMSRWAICDRASFSAAQSGLAPGWAYRTDSSHFTRSSGWMEVWGRDWQEASVICSLREGIVRDDYHSAVKAEALEEGALDGKSYVELVRKVYEQEKPEKLDDLEKLVEKYRDREHELFRDVCAKYSIDADVFLAQHAEA